MTRLPKIVRRIKSGKQELTISEQSSARAHLGIACRQHGCVSWFWLTPAKMQNLHQALGEIIAKRNKGAK